MTIAGRRGIGGPLFLGKDTHALSAPAFRSTLEALAGNGVHAQIDQADGYTPTPVISHAILTFNRNRTSAFADGIVITPSHNPPEDGGLKYNPPHGGPADSEATKIIEERANDLIAGKLSGVARVPGQQALKASTTQRHDYIANYVADRAAWSILKHINRAGLRIGVDPLGGSAIAYWKPIADRYELNLDIVNPAVDPTFRFMSLDWDGKIRIDCSSPYAMASLIALKDRFDLAFGNDTDADRHGIVTRSGGLMTQIILAAAIVISLCIDPDGGLTPG